MLGSPFLVWRHIRSLIGKRENKEKEAQVIMSNNELKAHLESLKWGKSSLSEYIEAAYKNILASYVNLNPYFKLLEDVCRIFQKAQSFISCGNEKEIIIASLINRSLGSFVSSVRLGASGQLTESYAQLRLCLEYALYAFYMNQDPNRIQIWNNRKKDIKLFLNTFRPVLMRKELKDENPKIGNSAETLYNKSIEYGAHPNLWGVAPTLKASEDGVMSLILCADGVEMGGCLILSTDFGLTVLSIFNLIYPEQFKKGNIPIMIENARKTFKPMAIATAQML
ncbi:MAG: hypothetical protein ACYS0I_16985, partial [Planctomycetota bacterium]